MLVLHFDFVSPASAVAMLRLQRIADAGGDVAFLGIDPLGLEVAVPATLEQLEEFERWRDPAARLGLAMRRPVMRPPTLRAHVVGELAERSGLGPGWRWACLVAYWIDQLDLGDPAVLESIAMDVGLGGDARDLLDDASAIRVARQRAATAHRRGIGGVPVLEVDGTFVSAHLDEEALLQLAGR